MAEQQQIKSLARSGVSELVKLLIHNLVNIKDESGEFLLKLDDGRVIDTKGWNDWEWTHGIGLYGMWKFHEITADGEAYEIMTSWFRDRFAQGVPTKNVNTVSPFLTLAYLYEVNQDRTYLPYLDAWAEWVYHDMPRTEEGGLQHMTYVDDHDGQLWDDTLMMCVLPLAKIGLLLGRLHYVEEAKRQFLVHIKYLVDRKTGLWFHGWTFNGRHHFANALWGRGNSWLTICIPEFIELLQLPADHFMRQHLVSTLIAQVDALVKYQDSKSGLWHTLLDDPTSYLESSCAAGFAYGILKAIRLRLLPPKPEYTLCAERAIEGIIENIAADGELQQVSFGTPVFDTLQGYKDLKCTSMPYGQAMAMLALAEFMRKFS